jgi:ubiquinone/menaquinone biosynthesis C-methylase UbiE
MNTRPEEIQAAYYERTASGYDDQRSTHEAAVVAASLEFVNMFSGLHDLHTFLDIGAGTGRCMQYLLDRGKEVRGIEPVAQLIQEAERKGIPAGMIQQGTGYSLPYPDKSVDACIECAVLHHLANPDRVVSEMMRVAKKAIFLVDSNRFGHGSYVARIMKLVLYAVGLWKAARFIQTGGRMYSITEGDGLAYSYSVYDSYHQLAKWADYILLIPADHERPIKSWLDPLLTSPGVILCAIRGDSSGLSR